MPPDSKPDRPSTGEDLLRNFILLALPLLSFQREVLGFAKKSVQDAGKIKPAEKFAMSELHALLMIVDPSRTIRDRLPDFEQKAEDLYNEVLPKLTSASVQLIEAQERVLTGAFDVLNTLRKGKKAKRRSDSQ